MTIARKRSSVSPRVNRAKAADYNGIGTPVYDPATGRGSSHVPALVADLAGSVAPPPPPPAASPHFVGLASWAANRLDVFGRGTDSGMWHKAWDGSLWSVWEPQGGSLAGPPSAVSRAANLLDVVYRGSDNALWHQAWNGSQWLPLESLGRALTSEPVVVSRTASMLDVFVRGPDNAVERLGVAGRGPDLTAPHGRRRGCASRR